MASVKISDITKLSVKNRADQLIESYLKPTFIEPPPEDKQFNYLVDIFSKWHGRYFYMCSKYACPSPNAISPFFEHGFARLEYIADNRYNLSYMRYTEQWVQVEFGISLEECFEAIKTFPYFHP